MLRTLITFSIIITFNSVIYGQDWDFKRKTIHITEIDTNDDYIEFRTKGSRILVDKNQFLNTQKNKEDSFCLLLKTTNRPQVCLIETSKFLHHCDSSIHPEDYKRRKFVLSYDLADIIIQGYCKIYQYNNPYSIKKIKARRKAYKAIMGTEYMEFRHPKSGELLFQILTKLGE